MTQPSDSFALPFPVRSPGLLALAAALSLGLAGCGDSPSETKEDAGTGTAAGLPASPEKTPEDGGTAGTADPEKGNAGTSPTGSTETESSPPPAPEPKDPNMKVTKSDFGEVAEGKVDLFTLTNGNGIEVRIMSYGGAIVSLKTPDRDGQFADIVLGFNTVQEYVDGSPYFGCITGRYANRIAKGKFTLEGKEYTLAVNNDANHLHGGLRGFDKRLWKGEELHADQAVGVAFTYTSADGEEGYPGNLACKVTYLLTVNNQLRVNYEATTDQPTVLNLTNHSYWNLKGEGNGDILGHLLLLNSRKYTRIDPTMIPTGLISATGDTPLDFQRPTAIGDRIDADFEQIKIAGGYDHNYVVANTTGTLASAARVVEPTTGRVLEIYTTEPGIQFYSGNFLDGSLTGKSGQKYARRSGFCLETQHFPDSPNHPQFPSTTLRPGETFKSSTIHQFNVEKH